MPKSTFSLIPAPKSGITHLAPPAVARVPVCCHAPLVKPGDEVCEAAAIGRSPDPAMGDVHAPFAARVLEVSLERIVLERLPGRETPRATEEPEVDVSGLCGGELRRALSRLGADTGFLTRAETLVVSGLETEPGVCVHTALLAERAEEIRRGIQAAMSICGAQKAFMVLPHGAPVSSIHGVEIIHSDPVYPLGLVPLAIKAATGKEAPEGVDGATLHQVYLLGRAAYSGRPVTRTALSVAGFNLEVEIGTPISEVLEAKAVKVNNLDRVAIGGPFMGDAAYTLEQGVPKSAYALTHVPAGSFATTTDADCLGCGECRRACPARIRPDIIARMAEFSCFERTEEEYVWACMECGLCGYYCTARRPLLQYIRLAKQELAALDHQSEQE